MALALAVGCCAPSGVAFAQGASGLAAPTDARVAPAAPSTAAPSDAAPTETAPSDAAPSETAPSDAAPSDAAPSETAASAAVGDASSVEAEASEPAVDPADFDGAERDLGQTRGVWVLDDGVGLAEVPWDDFDPGAEYTPRDPIHLGIQLRVGALPGGSYPLLDGPLIELGAIFDARYSARSPWHMRVLLAASFQNPADENLGAGVHVFSSPFALKLRVLPISIDLQQWGALRAGGEIGIQYVPQLGGDGIWMVLPGVNGEAVVRLLDGVLEIGAFGGFQWTGIGRSTRSGFFQELGFEGVVGVSVGYLLL